MPVIAGVLDIMIAIAWLLIVTPQYVRVASDRYSDALVEVPNEQGAAPQ